MALQNIKHRINMRGKFSGFAVPVKIFLNKIKEKFQRKSGFTIVEALVSILIITISMIPGLRSINATSLVSESIESSLIASQLAQEGIEVVRYLRDKNSIDCGDFKTGLVGSWIIEHSPVWTCGNRALVPLGSNPNLLISPAGIYNYSSGVETKFKRRVTISEVVSDVELMVVVEVSWPSRSRTTGPGCTAGYHCVIAESHLFNWIR